MYKSILNLNKALTVDYTSTYYVGLVVVDKARKKILLGKRREDGMWTGPGGSAQGEENPKQAGIREAFEESNLQLKPRDLKELPTQVVKNGKVCHCFLVDVDSKAVKIHSTNDPDREVAKWDWYSLNEPLPGKIDHNRLNSINNAKMKIWGLKKSILENPDAGVDLNTAEQSQDELALKDSTHWAASIRHTMHGVDYGEAPRALMLDNYLTLHLSKVDDGLFSGIVIKDDPMAGDHGETQTQLIKMTPESMVQALKAKGYIRIESSAPPSPAPMETKPAQDYKGLFNALKRFQGDLHIHLAKSLYAALKNTNNNR